MATSYENTRESILKIRVDAATAIEQLGVYRQALESLRIEAKLLENDLRNGGNQKDYVEGMARIDQQARHVKDSMKDLTRVVQNQLKVNERKTGSLVALRAELSRLTREYDNLSRVERNSGKGTELLSSIRSTTAEIKNAEAATMRFYRNVGNYQSALNGIKKLTSGFGGLFGMISAAAGGIGLANMGQDMVRAARDFEDGMARVRAVSNATAKDLSELTDKARELGRTTRYTAQEAAAGMEELARKGFSTRDMLESIKPVLELAQANVVSIADAAQISSSTMRAFAMTADGLAHINDVLSSACANSATNLTMLGEAMKVAGPAAKAANVSLEETTSLIGALANVGMTGSDAGTGVKQVMMALTTAARGTKAQLAVLKKYNLDITESRIRTEGLLTVLQDMKKSGIGNSLADLKVLGGKYASPRMAQLVNSVDTAIDLNHKLENSFGANERMFNQSLGNTSQAVYKLKSVWESFLIDLWDDESGGRFVGIIKDITKAIEFLSKNIDVLGRQVIILFSTKMLQRPALAAWGVMKTIGGTFSETYAVVKAQAAGEKKILDQQVVDRVAMEQKKAEVAAESAARISQITRRGAVANRKAIQAEIQGTRAAAARLASGMAEGVKTGVARAEVAAAEFSGSISAVINAETARTQVAAAKLVETIRNPFLVLAGESGVILARGLETSVPEVYGAAARVANAIREPLALPLLPSANMMLPLLDILNGAVAPAGLAARRIVGAIKEPIVMLANESGILIRQGLVAQVPEVYGAAVRVAEAIREPLALPLLPSANMMLPLLDILNGSVAPMELAAMRVVNAMQEPFVMLAKEGGVILAGGLESSVPEVYGAAVRIAEAVCEPLVAQAPEVRVAATRVAEAIREPLALPLFPPTGVTLPLLNILKGAEAEAGLSAARIAEAIRAPLAQPILPTADMMRPLLGILNEAVLPVGLSAARIAEAIREPLALPLLPSANMMLPLLDILNGAVAPAGLAARRIVGAIKEPIVMLANESGILIRQGFIEQEPVVYAAAERVGRAMRETLALPLLQPEVGQTLIDRLNGLVAPAKTAAERIRGAVAGALMSLRETVVAVGLEMAGGLKSTVPGVDAAAKELASTVRKELVVETPATAAAAQEQATVVLEAIVSAAPAAAAAAQEQAAAVAEAIMSTAPTTMAAAQEQAAVVTEAIVSAAPTTAAAAQEQAAVISEAIASAAPVTAAAAQEQAAAIPVAQADETARIETTARHNAAIPTKALQAEAPRTAAAANAQAQSVNRAMQSSEKSAAASMSRIGMYWNTTTTSIGTLLKSLGTTIKAAFSSIASFLVIGAIMEAIFAIGTYISRLNYVEKKEKEIADKISEAKNSESLQGLEAQKRSLDEMHEKVEKAAAARDRARKGTQGEVLAQKDLNKCTEEEQKVLTEINDALGEHYKTYEDTLSLQERIALLQKSGDESDREKAKRLQELQAALSINASQIERETKARQDESAAAEEVNKHAERQTELSGREKMLLGQVNALLGTQYGKYEDINKSLLQRLTLLKKEAEIRVKADAAMEAEKRIRANARANGIDETNMSVDDIVKEVGKNYDDKWTATKIADFTLDVVGIDTEYSRDVAIFKDAKLYKKYFDSIAQIKTDSSSSVTPAGGFDPSDPGGGKGHGKSTADNLESARKAIENAIKKYQKTLNGLKEYNTNDVFAKERKKIEDGVNETRQEIETFLSVNDDKIKKLQKSRYAGLISQLESLFAGIRKEALEKSINQMIELKAKELDAYLKMQKEIQQKIAANAKGLGNTWGAHTAQQIADTADYAKAQQDLQWRFYKGELGATHKQGGEIQAAQGMEEYEAKVKETKEDPNTGEEEKKERLAFLNQLYQAEANYYALREELRTEFYLKERKAMQDQAAERTRLENQQMENALKARDVETKEQVVARMEANQTLTEIDKGNYLQIRQDEYIRASERLAQIKAEGQQEGETREQYQERIAEAEMEQKESFHRWERNEEELKWNNIKEKLGEEVADRYRMEIESLQNTLANEQARGQLVGETVEEFNARILAAREELVDKEIEVYNKSNEATLQRLQNEYDENELADQERVNQQMGYFTDLEYGSEEYWGRVADKLGEHEAEQLQLKQEMADEELRQIEEQGQLESETKEEYQARINDATKKQKDVQTECNNAMQKSDEAKAKSFSTLMGGTMDLMKALGEDNKALAAVQKGLTLAQIAMDTASAISSAVKTAAEKGFPACIPTLATMMAMIMTNIATAISTVKGANFAEGGKVRGPGTGTSDSINARLSNGEYVMTARATKLYEPLLSAMNGIGRGVALPQNGYVVPQQTANLSEAFSTAVAGIRPVVDVQEITRTQNRVEALEYLDAV